MEINVSWYGEAVTKAVTTAVGVGLAKGGGIFKSTAKSVLNTPYPPASRPGEVPHKRSGDLLEAQDASLRSLPGGGWELHLGVLATAPANVRRYAEALTKGTTTMRRRQWMGVVMERTADPIVAAVSAAVAKAVA